jgi:hypothetical protein
MTTRATTRPVFEPGDAVPVVVLFVLAFGIHLLTATATATAARIPLSALGLYFDGHLYIEIARSFPLPYASEGPDYYGHSPGYPALIYLLRLVTPSGLMNWGALALLASWISGALSAVAFYAVCRTIDLRPFWPSVTFVALNPRWLWDASTSHSESLAMLLALLCLLAALRGRLAWAVLWLSLAGLTRYPAFLLGAPLAFATLVVRRDRRVQTLALLSVPLLAFALINLYLYVRIPDFSGIAASHRVFWDAHLTWPFATLIGTTLRWDLPGDPFLTGLTYASLGLYLLSIALGLQSERRDLLILPLWVAVIVLLPACLDGERHVWAFTRLAILAWPGALLIVWPRWLEGTRRSALFLLCVTMALLAISLQVRRAPHAIRMQNETHWFLSQSIERLDSNEPTWIDFRALSSSAGSGEAAEPPRR